MMLTRARWCVYRQDCRDGHPEFLAKKSLEFIVDCLKEEDGLE
jgi:hypothetical protein